MAREPGVPVSADEDGVTRTSDAPFASPHDILCSIGVGPEAVAGLAAVGGRREARECGECVVATGTLLYFVSDLHGSSLCFRKFVNATQLVRG